VTICALYNLKTMFQMYAVSVMHVRQKKAWKEAIKVGIS
jgi:hypothetical protein